MSQPNNLRRCHTTLDQDSSHIAVVEMNQSSWLVAGIVPRISRQPAKKLKPDQTALLGLLRRWRDEAAKAGRRISRLVVAFEAGRDGFGVCPEGACHLRRKVPSRQLSINLEADERLGRVTGRVEAS